MLRYRTKTLSIYSLSATKVSTFELIHFLKGEGKAFKAYEVLKDCQSSKNRYKFALICIKLNRYNEAELALSGAKLP